MSQLAKKLEWAPTGRVTPVYDEILPIVETEQAWHRDARTNADEFRLGLRLGVIVSISEVERALDKGGLWSNVMKDARQQIIEEVYGEFRAPLMRIERAVYARKWQESLEEIRRLRDAMFGDA